MVSYILTINKDTQYMVYVTGKCVEMSLGSIIISIQNGKPLADLIDRLVTLYKEDPEPKPTIAEATRGLTDLEREGYNLTDGL